MQNKYKKERKKKVHPEGKLRGWPYLTTPHKIT